MELQGSRLGFQIGSQVAVFSAGLVRSRGSLQLAMADPTSLIGSLALQVDTGRLWVEAWQECSSRFWHRTDH